MDKKSSIGGKNNEVYPASGANTQQVGKSKKEKGNIQDKNQSMINLTEDKKGLSKTKGKAASHARLSMPSTLTTPVGKNIKKFDKATEKPLKKADTPLKKLHAKENSAKFKSKTGPTNLKVNQVLPSKTKGMGTKPDTEVRDVKAPIKVSEEKKIDESKKNLDVNFSEDQGDLLSETTGKPLEVANAENLSTMNELYGKERKTNVEVTTCLPIITVQQVLPSATKSLGAKRDTKVRHVKAPIKVSEVKEIDESMKNLDANFSEDQGDLLSESPEKTFGVAASLAEKTTTIKGLYAKANGTKDEATTVLTNLEQEMLPLESKSLEAKPDTVVRDSKDIPKVSEVMDMEEKLRNVKSYTSKALEGVFSNVKSKLSKIKIRPDDRIINLKSDANVRFEFDELGNKLLVDEVCYDVTEKKKITCNIDGNNQLSFNGNDFYISSKEFQIHCIVRNNRISFSFNNNSTKNIEILSKDSNAFGHSKDKDALAVKKFDKSDEASTTTNVPLDFSKITLESSYENINESTSNIGLSSSKASVQQRLTDITETFVTSIKTSCEMFERSFLETLRK